MCIWHTLPRVSTRTVSNPAVSEAAAPEAVSESAESTSSASSGSGTQGLAGAPKRPKGPDEREHPFQIAKFLTWSFFVLILGVNLIFSVFLADYGRRILIEKQESFALLLAENINHQIFQRFTLPTIIGFGRIELSNEVQYDRLDKVITSTTHSFHVQNLRIFDEDEVISYATDRSQVGSGGMAGALVARALSQGENGFQVLSRFSGLSSFFRLNMQPGDVELRTVYALRAERRETIGDLSGPIIGVLDFTQDITTDYEAVINFQRLIILAVFLTSLLLFVLVIAVIRRADAMLYERAKKTRRLERELLQSEKLASMGRMVAGVAHEIRNPLGIIRSSSELLVKRAHAESSPTAPILQAIFDETKRLQRTVNDFLDYARPKNPRMDAINLAECLHQALVFQQGRLEELDIHLRHEFDNTLPVRGDKDLLYRAIYNLIANAIDALAEVEGERTLRILGHVQPDGSVLLVFEDSGPGFPPDVIDHVRDPFFTTKENGTGLGLAIIDNILTSHGAMLDISNSDDPDGNDGGDGGGAHIEIRFPTG